MSFRVVINGKEVKNPLVKYSIGFISFIALTLFGILFAVLILPLIGITLVVTLSTVLVIAAISLMIVAIALSSHQQQGNNNKNNKASELDKNHKND